MAPDDFFDRVDILFKKTPITTIGGTVMIGVPFIILPNTAIVELAKYYKGKLEISIRDSDNILIRAVKEQK